MTKVTSATVTLLAPVATSGGSSSGSDGAKTQPSQNVAVVLVNGEKQNVGVEKKTIEEGRTTITIVVDKAVINSKIDEAVKSNTTGNRNEIQVIIEDSKSEVSKVEINGEVVKRLELNNFDISVKRDDVEYIVPSIELEIDKVAEQLGVDATDWNDIKIEVRITKLDETVVEKYREVARTNDSVLIFPPVSFEIVTKTKSADGTNKEVEINKFRNYVERILEIPSDVDPDKITTGIVFNTDGTYSHVPTEIFKKDNKWFAKLNSLTNSEYSVIWNSVSVKSVEKHWAKDAVNDMASRLIVFDWNAFDPNKAITRADFAEYIVRALGLYRDGSKYINRFSDVYENGDRTLAILIASDYGIIAGHPDGTFRPDALISREEAMTMYQRAMKITNLVGTDKNRYQSYSDYDQVGSWAISDVKEVLSAHVFNGTTTTAISPKSNLTYAEATQAIKNLLVKSGIINN